MTAQVFVNGLVVLYFVAVVVIVALAVRVEHRGRR